MKKVIVTTFCSVLFFAATAKVHASEAYDEYSLKTQDQDGTLDCDKLLQDMSSGKYDGTKSFKKLLTRKYPTVYHYEQNKGYRFKSCKLKIIKQKSDWCKSLTENAFGNSKIFSNNEADVHCKSEIQSWASLLRTEPFGVIEGDNPLIKIVNTWTPAASISVTVPTPSYDKDVGLYTVCVHPTNFPMTKDCNMYYGIEKATTESNRLIKIISEIKN